jgi:hypothetical protein
VTDPSGDPPGAREQPVRLRDGLVPSLVVFAALRLALLAVSALGVGAMELPPDQPTGVPGWPAATPSAGAHNAFTATERQDALWFLRIAADGYAVDDASAAFFPLYPLAIRAVDALPGVGPLGAALVVSNGACLTALVVFHGLTRRELGERTFADRATRWLALVPTSFFLLAPYSESLFLALVLLSFWWAGGGRWPAAAAAGLAAGLTRAVGVVLAPALALEARRAAGAATVARIAAAAAPAAALAVVAALWWSWSGDPLAPVHAQSAWRPEASPPWVTLVRGLEHALRFGGWWAVDAAFVLGAMGLLAAGASVIRAPFLIYGWASLVVPMLAMFPGRPFLSIPRFSCVVFPLAWFLAWVTGRWRWLDIPLTVVFAVTWVMLGTAFVNWQYIF